MGFKFNIVNTIHKVIMINYSKKSIFVHIYKTAGTSIREKLSKIEGAKEPYVSKGILNRIAYKLSKKLRIYGFNFFF